MKPYFKYFLPFLLVLFAAQPLIAQISTQDADVPPAKADNKPAPKKKKDKEETNPNKLSNLYVGGIPGFGINSYYVNVDIAAEVGYFVHPHIALGMQTAYSYVLDKYYDVSYNVVRISPYARGYIWKGIFAQAEYQLTSIRNYKDFSDPVNYPNGQVIPVLNNSSLRIGGGYHENFQKGFGFYFAVLFNVVNTSNALAANPDFKVGLTYRFGQPMGRKNKKATKINGNTIPPIERTDDE